MRCCSLLLRGRLPLNAAPSSGPDATLSAVTVIEFLKLAPFSLGTITILIAAGGLIFGHAYGRYGDDAAISFLLRWRFLVAAILAFAAPALMLISFARGTVPSWLTAGGATAVVGLGVVTTAGVVGYLLLYVSRPGRFLAAVGSRVTVRRLNRYALAVRWQRHDEFESDIAARRYQWFGIELNLGSAPEPQCRGFGRRAGRRSSGGCTGACPFAASERSLVCRRASSDEVVVPPNPI